MPRVAFKFRASPWVPYGRPGRRYGEHIVPYRSHLRRERVKKARKAQAPAVDSRHSFTLAEGYQELIHTLPQYTITYFLVFHALPLLGSNFYFSHFVRIHMI
jgi:hypothetical protein